MPHVAICWLILWRAVGARSPIAVSSSLPLFLWVDDGNSFRFSWPLPGNSNSKCGHGIKDHRYQANHAVHSNMSDQRWIKCVVCSEITDECFILIIMSNASPDKERSEYEIKEILSFDCLIRNFGKAFAKSFFARSSVSSLAIWRMTHFWQVDYRRRNTALLTNQGILASSISVHTPTRVWITGPQSLFRQRTCKLL